MEKSTTTMTTSTTPAPTTTTTPTATPAPTTTVAPTTAPAPATTASSGEELCGSANILDTVHLKNLVDDLSKLYGTCVNTKVARDTKIAAEKRLIEAIRANLDRYES